MEKPIVFVTEVGSCYRPYHYKVRGLERHPSHYYSARGKVTHRALEMALLGKEPSWDYRLFFPEGTPGVHGDDLGLPPEMFEKCLGEARAAYGKGRRWFSDTSLIKQGEKIWVEEEFKKDMGDFILCGHPDLMTKTAIFDFKSGKKRVTDDHRWQLTGYEILTGRKETYLVFLGEEKAIEVEVPKSDRDAILNTYIREAQKAADWKRRAASGEIPPAQVGFGCVWCPYVGRYCQGV